MRAHVLWGIPPWGGAPIQITSGTPAHVRREYKAYEAAGWFKPVSLRVYLDGTVYPADLAGAMA